MTKKELEEIRNRLSDKFEDNYFPTVMSPGFTVAPYANRYVLGECFIDGFDACADLLLPIIKDYEEALESNKKTLKHCLAAMDYAYEDHVDQYYLNVKNLIEAQLEHSREVLKKHKGE